MTRRYADAAILDKLKQLREVNFYEGTPMEGINKREVWEKTEQEIATRYSTKDFKAIRRNGFSGMSFEHRADTVGLTTMYDECYRVASRNIHMFDPAETLYGPYAYRGRPKEKGALLRARRAQLESNQNMLLGRMSWVLADFIDSPLLSGQLLLIGLGYEKYRDRTTGPVKRDPGMKPDPPGSFRIWRE